MHTTENDRVLVGKPEGPIRDEFPMAGALVPIESSITSSIKHFRNHNLDS